MLLPGFPLLLADKNASFWFPAQASTFAKEVDDFYMYIMYISVVFFVLIVAAMGWFTLQYRRRPGYQGDSRALHNNALEITWTVIPTLIVIWIFARGVYGDMDMMRPPADTIDVNVTAQKWAWSFQYPNGAISNELHISVDCASACACDLMMFCTVCSFQPSAVKRTWFLVVLCRCGFSQS